MNKYSVFIGRFQPVHIGHLQIIKQALEKTDELIIVLGSANRSIEPYRNPFTVDERTRMILLACLDAGIDINRIHISAVEDHPYNDNRWIDSVQAVVHSHIWKKFSPDAYETLLIGHKKDQTSFYLDLFPTWGSISVDNFKGINSTNIRMDMLRGGSWDGNRDVLTNSVIDFLKDWDKSENCDYNINEYQEVERIKARWAGAPFEPTFNTVDNVVTQAGHVLMVTRAFYPGYKRLALPGGYLNPRESLIDSAMRELKQESKIDVPEKVLRGSVKWNRTFDDPNRSSRGRIITEAYHIDLGNSGKLPKVKGKVYKIKDENGELNDTMKAEWIELSKLDGTKIFEDHLAIIRTMVGI